MLDLKHGQAVAQSLSRIRGTLLKGNNRETPLCQMLDTVGKFKENAAEGAVSNEAVQRILQTTTTLMLQKLKCPRSIKSWIEHMPACGRFIVSGWPIQTNLEMAVSVDKAKNFKEEDLTNKKRKRSQDK